MKGLKKYSTLFKFYLTLLCAVSAQGLDSIDIPRQLPPCPANHIRDILVDRKGAIWVAPENSEIYCLDPDQSYAGPWRSLKYSTGIPDTLNFTCLTEDQQGRIWVGTDNKGVGVFNGESWKIYDWKNTLPDNHISALAVSPDTGEIAIATAGGLAIYHPSTEEWLIRTRATGLTENQISSLAFDKTGNLWVAYFCGGISFSNKKSEYSTWKTTQAPWVWNEQPYSRQPLVPSGMGLSSNLCNAVLAAANGSILVGTCSGLSYKNKKNPWEFLRGKDYMDKNKGLFENEKLAKKNIARKSNLESLLPEDFVTSLHETPKGYWCGFRRQGAAFLDKENLRVRSRKEPDEKTLPSPWITAITSLPDGTVIGGTYGKGIAILDRGLGTWTRKNTAKNMPIPPFPSASITEQQDHLSSQINAFPNNGTSRPTKQSPIVFWKEDWMTRGNWCGRYGQEMAALCAANAPLESAIIYQSTNTNPTYQLNTRGVTLVKEKNINIWGLMGPHRKNDGLRHWVHHLNDQYNPNVLYCPTDATRTEAEWDDHGEAYPYTFDGPDVCTLVQVLDANCHIDLYFFNPNGRKSPMGLRDYLIEIKKIATTQNPVFLERAFSLPEMKKELTRIVNEKVLIRTRVNHFSGTGVYKRFLVKEPGYYLFRIVRNYSFNTILNGVFVSSQGQIAKTNFNPLTLDSDFAGISPHPPDVNPDTLNQHQKTLLSIANHITSDPCTLDHRDDILRRFLRKNLHNLSNDPLAEQIRWTVNDFTDDDFQHFHDTMQNSWTHKQDTQPAYRSAEFMPHAPNVIPFSIEEVKKMHVLNIDWKQYLPASTPSKSVEEMKIFLKSQSIGKPSNKMTKRHQEAIEKTIMEHQREAEKSKKGK